MNEIKRLITTVLLVAIIVGAGMYFAMGSQGEVDSNDEANSELREQLEEQEDRIKELEEQLEQEDAEDEEETDEIASKCNFDHGLDLKRGANLDIFGPELWEGEEFETVICGHFVSQEANVFGEDVTNAYLSVQEFEDADFLGGIVEGIVTGNSINSLDTASGNYLWNLGCFENGVIEGVDHNATEQYMNAETRRAILASTEEEPVTLLLKFGARLETGCFCCNLANTVRVIK